VAGRGEKKVPAVFPPPAGRLSTDAVRVGLYEPKLRDHAKGTGRDHGNAAEPVFHQDFDYLDRIARLTSHIPQKGLQLVHYDGAYSNAHLGTALRHQAFTLPNPGAPPQPPEQDPGRLRERRRSARSARGDLRSAAGVFP